MKGIYAGALALLLAGTLTVPAQADFSNYLKNRGNDFLDIFRLRAGYPEHGRGIGLKLRATTLLQVGYVDFDGTYAGLDRRGVGVVDEKRREAGVSVLYGSWNEMVTTSGNEFLKADTNWSILEDRRLIRNLPHWDDGRRRPLSFGIELALPFGAIDLGLYPEELFDFVIGLTTLDVFNDDVPHDVALPFAEPTTAPAPKTDAPFADRRALNEKRKAALAERMLEELGQAPGEAEEGAVLVPVNAPGRARVVVVPTEAPVVEPASTDSDTITESQADRSLEALQQIEGIQELLDQTRKAPSEDGRSR